MLARSTDAGDTRSFSLLVQEAEEAGERQHGWTAAKHHRRAGQVSLEVLEGSVGLRSPLEWALLLHQLEEG